MLLRKSKSLSLPFSEIDAGKLGLCDVYLVHQQAIAVTLYIAKQRGSLRVTDEAGPQLVSQLKLFYAN